MTATCRFERTAGAGATSADHGRPEMCRRLANCGAARRRSLSGNQPVLPEGAAAVSASLIMSAVEEAGGSGSDIAVLEWPDLALRGCQGGANVFSRSERWCPLSSMLRRSAELRAPLACPEYRFRPYPRGRTRQIMRVAAARHRGCRRI